MERSSMTRIFEKPLAMFFFQKASDLSASWSAETCLCSLARQLSWNNVTQQFEPLAESKYVDRQSKHIEDSTLGLKECLDLLKQLLSQQETYIMIDAVDECETPDELLQALQDLKNAAHALHLMVCGRNDSPIVSDYFENCLEIRTNSKDALIDQDYFIDTEIDTICRRKPNSPFATFQKTQPDRVKDLLKKKADGLFRWIEIQIEVFGQVTGPADIDDQLKWLESNTIPIRPDDKLNMEYKRLLDRLKGSRTEGNLSRAIKMLRLIACSE
jgi:hypothetical protein